MHILTARILDVSNEFQNTNFPTHERSCVITPLYYLYWFERSYPNFPINRYHGPFCLQCMNGIQGTKPSGRKCNRLHDSLIAIHKYNKRTFYHDIYIKLSFDVTV